MRIYLKSLKDFHHDIYSNQVDIELKNSLINYQINFTKQEIQSWKNSLQYISNSLNLININDSVWISLELFTHYNSKQRIDVVLFGHDFNDKPKIAIIELKQWTEVKLLDDNDVNNNEYLLSYIAGRERRLRHPSVQSLSYQSTFKNFNSFVNEKNVDVVSCSYLHNLDDKKQIDFIKSKNFSEILNKSPLWTRMEVEDLSLWLKNNVGKGNGQDLAEKIIESDYFPSKNVVNMFNEILTKNNTFHLTDHQSEIIDKIVSKKEKINLIYGEPGTGKTIVAINLFKKLLNKAKNVIFVTTNGQLKETIIESLSKSIDKKWKKSILKNMIVSHHSFMSAKAKYDYIIVDEAQGIYPWNNILPVKDIILNLINSTNKLILFYDDKQRLRVSEIGGQKPIKKIISEYTFLEEKDIDNSLKLNVQLRSAGSNELIKLFEYLFDETNSIKKPNSSKLSKMNIKFFDNPKTLYENVIKLNTKKQMARVLATYSWKWISQKDSLSSKRKDIVFSEYNFKATWNHLEESTWSISDSSLDQIGSIHATRGQEFDHIGLLIGEHIIYKDNKIQVDWSRWYGHAKHGSKNNLDLQKEIVLNEIYTLMTRARKSCYIWIENKELRNYIHKKWKIK